MSTQTLTNYMPKKKPIFCYECGHNKNGACAIGYTTAVLSCRQAIPKKQYGF